MQRWPWWVVGGLALVLLLAVGGPFVYIHFIEGPPPPKLALPPTHGTAGTGTSAASAATGLDGTYAVGAGSEAGYRVHEVLIGQDSTAVGRTSKISGTVVISANQVTAATMTVDMASVTSDQSERNAQFDGRIMDVAQYPTATVRLTTPIALGTLPPVGSHATYSATADLTLHGATRPVNLSLSAERTGSGIYVLADVPVVFADWGIANPSVGGFVTTDSSGTIEVLVHLTRGVGNHAVTGTARGTGPGAGGVPAPVTVPRTTVPSLTIPTS